MTHYAIVSDLNRCVQCYACTVACKIVNGVPVGNYWNKVLRVGPNPKPGGSGHFPDVEMYYLPVGCQHCKNPECVKVCPTEASHIVADGTIQINKEKCIGCQFCVMACPYGVRYLNETEGVVEKCTLCEQKTAQGELPECVRQCGARARYFGDLEKGIETFVGPPVGDNIEFEPITNTTRPFTEEDIHRLPNVGNDPSFAYILRNRTWQGEE
ncbi:MAG: 4Fe-4S dicluster domain-containing protein [Coriobacteriales bacterium]